MKSERPWLIWIFFGCLALVIVLLIVTRPSTDKQGGDLKGQAQKIVENGGLAKPNDFRAKIASLLNIEDPDSLFINLPPRPNCYPGTIMAMDRGMPYLEEVNASDPELTRGAKAQEALRYKIGNDATAGFAVTNLVRGSLGDQAKAEIEITIDGVQIVDVKNAKSLKDRIIKSEKVKELEAKQLLPLVNYRSFEGLITFRISVTNGRKGRLEAKPKEFELSGEIKGDGEGSLVISSKERAVFAYLAVTTAYIQKNLAEQKLVFVPVRAPRLTAFDIAEQHAREPTVIKELNMK